MDRATIKPEIPESLMTDEKTHNVAGTVLTISALYYSGTNSEVVTELKLKSTMTNSVQDEKKMGDDFNDPSPGIITGLVVIAPQEDNHHKYEFQTNGRPDSPDHQEEIQQDTSIPAAKQEIMDLVIKEEETGADSMEEIYNNQIIKDEIEVCKESIVKTEGQPVVMKNELSEERLQEDFVKSERFDGDLGQSDDQVSRRTDKPRNHPKTVMATSYDGGSDSKNVSSKNDSQIDIKQEVHSGQNHNSDGHQSFYSDNRCHQCDICDKYYVNVSSLKIHLRQIHQMYCCDYCDSRFNQLIQYEEHLLQPNTNQNKICTKCDKTFMCLSQVIQHSSTPTGKIPYPCTTCHQTYEIENRFKIHQGTHAGEKPFLCTMCDKRFFDQSHLNIHQRTHTGEKPFVCNTCEKSYSTPGNLKVHQRTHTGEKPYICTVCNKSFKHPNSLKFHRRTHTGEKPYGCTMCNRSFRNQSHLNSHQRTHTGEKPYACTMCDKSYRIRGDLNVHQRTHTGEKPYGCTVCDKGFTRQCDLKRHQRTHTGEKPYGCTMCDKSFKTQSCLTVHQRKHRGEKP